MGIRAGGQVQVVGVGAQLLTVRAACTGGLAAHLANILSCEFRRRLSKWLVEYAPGLDDTKP